MKKILSLCLVLSTVFAGEADAQWRKTWDFTQGYSEETKSNLIADTEHWTVNRTDDDGNPTGWQDAVLMYGELEANGEVIAELEGLVFSSTGLNSSGSNFLLDPGTIRMTRASNTVALPKVTGGQTITLVARSANSSATDRGFEAASDELVYISGPADGICIGRNNTDPEGIRNSNGYYTLVWQVSNDIRDSVEVSIRLIGGGCDIQLIQIDDGDRSGEAKIGYIYDSSYSGYEADNNLELILNESLGERLDMQVVPVDLAGDVSLVTVDSLKGFDVVVVSPYITADNSYADTLKEAIAFTPMLNLNPDMYAAWGYGTAVQTGTNVLDVADATSDLFEPYDPSTSDYVENGQMEFLFDGYEVTGVSIPEGTYFASDNVLATANGITAIHMHNMSRNAYMLLPYTAAGGWNISAMDLIPNAVIMLNNTKRSDSNTATPTINQEYHNRYTTVTISCVTTNAQIYYTIDGSTPTEESTPYDGPFDISEEGVTVQAVAIADGFFLSGVSSQTIDIYDLAGTPAISYTEESGVSTVTITPADEDDVIYYNLTNSSDTLRSSVYTEPFQVTKHCTVTAFAKERIDVGTLQSETVSMDITVLDESVRLDVIAHMDANRGDWQNGGSAYVTAYSFYTDEVESIEEVTDSLGNVTTVINFVPANQVSYYNPGNGWQFKTYGQSGLWQNNSASHNVGDFNAYNPETALDDDDEITDYCVQLSAVSTTNSDGVTDPASACIETTVAYQGPFDVVGYVSGNNSTLSVLVTTDTTDVDSWQEIGTLYSGTISGTADNGRDGSTRIWKKTIVPYDGTDMVYVRVASTGRVANIFDIYLKNEGEASQAYVTGIKDVAQGGETVGEVIRTIIYSLNGTQLSTPAQGINIIKEIYDNGQVKTRKVFVK